MKNETQKLEALLFLAGDAVSKKELIRLLGQNNTEDLDKCIDDLKKIWQGRGLAIMTTLTHVQMVTSPVVADFVAKYLAEETRKISAAAAETLAIIAYRGPVTMHEIDALRGVDSRRVVTHLQQRALVRAANQKIPAKYVITEEFLRQLGVIKTDDLPNFEELSQDDKIEQLLNQANS